MAAPPMLGCFFLSSLFVAASTFGSHQLLWLFCDPPPSHGGINFWITLLYTFFVAFLFPRAATLLRSDTSAQPPQLRFIQLWKKAQSEGKDGQGRKVAGEISNVCQARSFCRIFNDYRESQLMDNNSFDVRWVTAHGPRHSALVKPFLEKRGPQGLEP